MRENPTGGLISAQPLNPHSTRKNSKSACLDTHPTDYPLSKTDSLKKSIDMAPMASGSTSGIGVNKKTVNTSTWKYLRMYWRWFTINCHLRSNKLSAPAGS
jgi:hypothetical protein